jgi:hypothetical protein
VIGAIVIESRTAQAINPPRQPHRAVLVTEYAGETVIRLHAHQDVDRGHGESLNDHTMFDELDATLSPSGQPHSHLGSTAATDLSFPMGSATCFPPVAAEQRSTKHQPRDDPSQGSHWGDLRGRCVLEGETGMMVVRATA